MFESTHGLDNRDNALTLRNNDVTCPRIQETHDILILDTVTALGGSSLKQKLFGIRNETDFGLTTSSTSSRCITLDKLFYKL